MCRDNSQTERRESYFTEAGVGANVLTYPITAAHESYQEGAVMSPDEKLGRRVIGAFLLGAFVALINFALDVSLIRLGITPHTYALNNLIIGAAAGLLAYIWMARQNARNELELSTQKLAEEIVQKERKRIALELHDTVCQAQTGAIMHLECAGDSLGESPEARKQFFVRCI